MRTLILVAGTNAPSNSATLADHFAQGVRESGGETEVLRLRDLSIAHFTLQHYDPTYQNEPDFVKLREAVLHTDGIVIASPIWNFSVPSHLKNAIDRMGSFALDGTHSQGMLRGKPVFLIFTGGAPLIAWQGLEKKTTGFVAESLKYFGASIAGTHFEPKCTLGRGQFGLVVDKRPESLAKMRSEGCRFAEMVKVFKETGKLPMKQSCMTAVYAAGQKLMKKLS
ncbi:MAG: NAD(P)H-dependent oxidoreductase [Candidatus Peregrinibacteria bacterium]